MKPPCTERYARWCERTAVSHRLLLDCGARPRTSRMNAEHGKAPPLTCVDTPPPRQCKSGPRMKNQNLATAKPPQAARIPQAANAMSGKDTTGGKKHRMSKVFKGKLHGALCIGVLIQLRYKKGARGKPLTPFMSAPSGEAALTESCL